MGAKTYKSGICRSCRTCFCPFVGRNLSVIICVCH
nr:MAG TPA: hypothetical protein [Caudoviricetes sp.]